MWALGLGVVAAVLALGVWMVMCGAGGRRGTGAADNRRLIYSAPPRKRHIGGGGVAVVLGAAAGKVGGDAGISLGGTMG